MNLRFFDRKTTGAPGLTIHDIIADLPVHPEKKYKKRTLDRIQGIILHHAAADWDDPVRYAKLHVEEHGWPGLGYHFMIGKDGKCYQTNQLNTISYHCSGNNMISLGILVDGNFMLHPPNPAQLQTLNLLLEMLHNINPKWWVVGHKEKKATDCPGYYFPLEEIKSLHNPKK